MPSFVCVRHVMVALKHVGQGGEVIHPLHGVEKLSGKRTL